MIKAIVEGRKTVTRRLSGLAEINKKPDHYRLKQPVGGEAQYQFLFECDCHGITIAKPRYLPDEVVYLEEAWAADKQYDDMAPRDIPVDSAIWYKTSPPPPNWVGKWRSPMFLMEWMAREFERILTVRPERLNGITPEDCIAEGIRTTQHGCYFWPATDLNPIYRTPQKAYAALWDSINGAGDFALNKWVFRYSFLHCDREGKAIGVK